MVVFVQGVEMLSSLNMAWSDTITFWVGPRGIVLLSVSMNVATEWSRPTDYVASTESINIHAFPVIPQYEPNDQMTNARVLYMRNIMPKICHGEL